MEQNKNKLFTNTLFVSLAAILCCALWGSATPFIKIGYQLIRPEATVASTILFAGVRFFFAGIITVVIYSIARKKFLFPKVENLRKVATVGLFQTIIQYFFFYMGLTLTSGVKGTIISGSNTFFSILIASLIFRQEKLTLKKLVACIFGFAGIIIVNLNGLELTVNWGDAFVLFSTIAYAVSSVLMKRYSNDEDPVVISGYQFIIGGTVMVVAGALMGGRIQIESLQAVGVLTYLSSLSAIAYALWGVLLKHNPVSRVTVFSFMIPVFGVILSELLLTEASGVSYVNLLIALALICIGITVLNYNKEKKQ